MREAALKLLLKTKTDDKEHFLCFAVRATDEAAYRRRWASLVSWCQNNLLTLNTNKTQEGVVDMRKERRPHRPLLICP